MGNAGFGCGYGCDPGYGYGPGYGCEPGYGSGFGWGFALLVVLFILLIIIGTCFINTDRHDDCC
jgi:uncharacterized protein (TIGR01732 family)